jgi:menaquinone-9 beta-reductase
MPNAEVLIVGAGPAGAVAATILARRGVRVLLVDRARFPRRKLCGDTLNPGTLRILERLGLHARIEAAGLPIDGMLLTGPNGRVARGVYGEGRCGRALVREELDLLLLEHAVRAGASFCEELAVRRPLLEPDRGELRVVGAEVVTRGQRLTQLRASVTIAADGRRSSLARALGLLRHPRAPRRWAAGGYFEGVKGLSPFGEMHVRGDHYIGVAPLPGGLANACLVSAVRARFADPLGALKQVLAGDTVLSERFASARLVGPVTSMGPLAVEARTAGVPGLLLAGDAAGFIDPMTGDGLRFAVQGAEFAACAALDGLESRTTSAHLRLFERRHREFRSKWRLNRFLRTLVSSPLAVRLAEFAAPTVAPLLRQIILEAGDVRLE